MATILWCHFEWRLVATPSVIMWLVSCESGMFTRRSVVGTDLGPLHVPDVLALQLALRRHILTTQRVDVVQHHDVGQVHGNKSTTATTCTVLWQTTTCCTHCLITNYHVLHSQATTCSIHSRVRNYHMLYSLPYDKLPHVLFTVLWRTTMCSIHWLMINYHVLYSLVLFQSCYNGWNPSVPWHCWMGHRKGIWPVKYLWLSSPKVPLQKRWRKTANAATCKHRVSLNVAVNMKAVAIVVVVVVTFYQNLKVNSANTNVAYGCSKRVETRMRANAQRDGCPAEYRWRPLFNAAKFGWHPLLKCREERCQDVKPVEICRGAPKSPTDLSR